MRSALTTILLAIAATAWAEGQPAQDELKRLSIEELMQIDVTTASRQAEPLATTAAAISVITGDDIRRAGVTTIADALMLADGVHLARTNNGTWNITARGFNSGTANKLLVMVDGRTVYSPLFTGVFWNMVDYLLEDIDRIEVIRGPGAVLWGANAVNGVINIITRHSADTQGMLASVSSGNEDPAIAELRYGSVAGAVSWRGYAKFAARDNLRFAEGGSAQDPRRRGQVGFRVDGGRLTETHWLIKGDIFHSRDSFADRPDAEFSDLNLQARWSAPLAPGSRVDVQSYYRREYRDVPLQLRHHIDVFDIDAQHALTRPRHHIVWGGGYRSNWDETAGSNAIAFEPRSRRYPVKSVFIQDEIALVPARLFTTVGAKYEHNAFSGGEFQPNVRARLLMQHSQTLWGAVARAVRRPTRLEDDLISRAPTGAPLIVGNDDFLAEKLISTEVGYRVQPAPVVSVDVTFFNHRFADLRSQDLPASGPPIVLGNSLRGESTGLEIGVNLQPIERWRAHVGYTRLDSDIEREPGSRDVSGGVSEANDPGHLFTVRNSLDLPRNLEFDAILRSVGALPNPRVPAYTELGLRVGWRATRGVELWVTGHDLLHDQHPEFGADLPTRVEFQRAIRVGVTFRPGR